MDHDLRVELKETLTKALVSLLGSRAPQGHWRDIRATATAAWAIGEVISGENVESAGLQPLAEQGRRALLWLTEQARDEPPHPGVSWESEGWDTSLGLIALTYDRSEKLSRCANAAYEWLACEQSGDGSWFGEPWESTLCTVAMIRNEREMCKLGRPRRLNVTGVLRWLNGLPSKRSGEFISTHYSGFLAWLLSEINQTPTVKAAVPKQLYAAYCRKTDAAVSWLLRTASENPGDLWSQYTFANAYAAYGLAKLASTLPSIGDAHIDDCLPVAIRWLRSRQTSEGGFEDVEDNALAVLALSAIADRGGRDSDELRVDLDTVLERVRRLPRACFLGYAEAVAPLAQRLKEILREMFPNLRVVDWRTDFRASHTIIQEIEDQTHTCEAAIFLITKDDEGRKGGEVIYTRRANIIFEVGFFTGRVALQNAILVREQGAELPSDWHGIIDVPFTSRETFDVSREALGNNVRKILFA